MAYNSVANFRDETVNVFKPKPKKCLKTPFNWASQLNLLTCTSQLLEITHTNIDPVLGLYPNLGK